MKNAGIPVALVFSLILFTVIGLGVLGSVARGEEKDSIPVYEVYPDKIVTPYGTVVHYREIESATPSTLAYALAIVAESTARIIVHSGEYPVDRVEISSYVENLEIEGIGKVVVKGTIIANKLTSLSIDNIVFENPSSTETASLVLRNVYNVNLTRLLFQTPLLLQAYNTSLISIEDTVGTASIVANVTGGVRLSIVSSAITAKEDMIVARNLSYITITGSRIYAGKTVILGENLPSVIITRSFIDTRGLLLEVSGEIDVSIRQSQLAASSILNAVKGTVVVEIDSSQLSYTQSLFTSTNSSLALVFHNTVLQPSQPLRLGTINGEQVEIKSKPVSSLFGYIVLTSNNSTLLIPINGYQLLLSYTEGTATIGLLMYQQQNGPILVFNTTLYKNEKGVLGTILVGATGIEKMQIQVGDENYHAVKIQQGVIGIRIPEASLRESKTLKILIQYSSGNPPTRTTTSPPQPASTTTTTPSMTTTTGRVAETTTTPTKMETTSTTTPATEIKNKTTTTPPPSTLLRTPQVVVTQQTPRPSPAAVIGALAIVLAGTGWLAYTQMRRRRQPVEVMPE